MNNIFYTIETILIKVTFPIFRLAKILFGSWSIYHFSIFTNDYVKGLSHAGGLKKYKAYCSGIIQYLSEPIVSFLVQFALNLAKHKAIHCLRLLLLMGLNPAIPVSIPLWYLMKDQTKSVKTHHDTNKTVTLAHAILLQALVYEWKPKDILHFINMGLTLEGIPDETPPFWDILLFGRLDVATMVYQFALTCNFCPLITSSPIFDGKCQHPYNYYMMDNTLNIYQYLRSNWAIGLGDSIPSEKIYHFIKLLGGYTYKSDKEKDHVKAQAAKDSWQLGVYSYLSKEMEEQSFYEEIMALRWKFESPGERLDWNNPGQEKVKWLNDLFYKNNQICRGWG